MSLILSQWISVPPPDIWLLPYFCLAHCSLLQVASPYLTPFSPALTLPLELAGSNAFFI